MKRPHQQMWDEWLHYFRSNFQVHILFDSAEENSVWSFVKSVYMDFRLASYNCDGAEMTFTLNIIYGNSWYDWSQIVLVMMSVLYCIPAWKIMLWCHNFAVFLFKLWLLYVKVTLGVHMIVVMMCFTWRILKFLYFCSLGFLGSLDYYFPLYITFCLSVSYLLAQFCMLKECGQFKCWFDMIKCSKADTI